MSERKSSMSPCDASSYFNDFNPSDFSMQEAEELFTPGQDMAYCPGVILQADEDPSSYNYRSGPDVDVNVDVSSFEMSSLPSCDFESEPRSNPLELFLSRIAKNTSKSRLNFVCRHISSVRKSLKQHESKTYPTQSLHRITSKTQKNIWKQLRVMYETEFSMQPPLNWMKCANEEMKSHAERVVMRFFEEGRLRRYNVLFCELVFSGEPRELCEKMRLKCCGDEQHQPSCVPLWNDLKLYMQTGLPAELNLPLSPDELSILQ